MMRGMVQQQRCPVPHGMSAAGGLERRALGRNIRPSSSIILLLRCLFVGIVACSGRLAASAMEAPTGTEAAVQPDALNKNKVPVEGEKTGKELVLYRDVKKLVTDFSDVRSDEESSTSEETWCEVVVTPRWCLGLRRFWSLGLASPKKDSLLVSFGVSVFRFSCYFYKHNWFRFKDVAACHRRAVSACDGTKLGRMVFEIAETERPRLRKKILGFRKSIAKEDLIPIYFFLKCQTPRKVDEKWNKCQGGNKSRMPYYNMLFDSYTHARLIIKPAGTVDSDQDQLPAADNKLAGRVLVQWKPYVIASCGKNELETWRALLTRNSRPPQSLHGIEKGAELNEQRNIPDDCTVFQMTTKPKFWYNYKSFDTYRYESNNDTGKTADEDGKELHIRHYSIPEMFPFRVPDLGEEESALIAHIKLLNGWNFRGIKTTETSLKDRKSRLTTIQCRRSDNVETLEKCHAKVKEDIGAANATIFVSANEYKYLLEFINLLVPSLEDPSEIDTENLKRYRFILEGEGAAEMLKGVTPPEPAKDKSPAVLSDDEIPLVTIRFKPVLWPSYSDLDWTVHLISSQIPVTRTVCAGQVSVMFNPTQWVFNMIEKSKIDINKNIQVELKVHPILPPYLVIGDVERKLAKNQIFRWFRREKQDVMHCKIVVSCITSENSFKKLETKRLETKELIVKPFSKILARSTIMFHVA